MWPPQHPLPHNLASKGSQEQAYPRASAFCDVWLLPWETNAFNWVDFLGGRVVFVFNLSMEVGKEQQHVQSLYSFFSPALVIALGRFPLKEWRSFRAATELDVCGGNVAVSCCRENDGQRPPGTGPQGNHCSCLTSRTCRWPGEGELGIRGLILPAVTELLCERWVRHLAALLVSFPICKRFSKDFASWDSTPTTVFYTTAKQS